MSYFRHGPAALVRGTGARFVVGSVLVSLGILLAAGGGSWDITNHLLFRPETFFSPPHALLYSGVGTAVVGAAMLFFASRSAGGVFWPAKLALAGVIILVTAGPVDFAWHLAFGLDGLLSPPHFVLVSGMVVSSLGSLAAMIYYKSISLKNEAPLRLPLPLIVIGILPVWLALSGIVDMFTLPFSETDYFNFDPDPTFAVVFAAVGFPFLTVACLYGASVLAGRRFGVLSITGAAFVLINMLSSIIPNDPLVPTIPFYALNIIPIVAADAILSYRYWRPFKVPVYAAGVILGMTFFTLYYPLIAHTYDKFVNGSPFLWSGLTAPVYFELLGTVYPFVIAPAAALGILGALAVDRLAATMKVL